MLGQAGGWSLAKGVVSLPAGVAQKEGPEDCGQVPCHVGTVRGARQVWPPGPLQKTNI